MLHALVNNFSQVGTFFYWVNQYLAARQSVIGQTTGPTVRLGKKLIFKIEPECDGSNPYMKLEEIRIKMTKLEFRQQETDANW